MTLLRISSLLLFLFLATPRPLHAAETPSGPDLETAGDYSNLTEHHGGRYALRLTGERVNAVLFATRSSLQFWTHQTGQPLFRVPEPFRPPFAILRTVQGQPVRADGSPYPNPPVPRSFLLQIDPDGAVRYAGDPWIGGEVFLTYLLQTSWGTTPAANDRAVLEILDEAWFGRIVLSAMRPAEQSEVPEPTGKPRTKPTRPVSRYVTVDADGRVTALEAPNTDIEGPLLAELGQLHQLEILDLHYSPDRQSYGHKEDLDHDRLYRWGLSGTIPSQLGALSRLRQLDLGYHHLTGAIPPELGQLASLERLDLGSNLLTGSIPGTLGHLKHLVQLSLDDNWLSGSIPPELGHLPQLEQVLLHHNNLAGCLPMRWQTVSIEVHSHDNRVWGDSGSLPFCLDEGPMARTFTGDFANLAENWAGQVQLEVQGNAVYATLQTVRSPVRQHPEVLFTIPEGFRPSRNLTWEVNGRSVRADGTLESGSRNLRAFRMSIDTEGNVRYVDDPRIDGVGYLRYRTFLAWPLAGAKPQVCNRSQAVQNAILASLDMAGPSEETCKDITWADLSDVGSLEIDAIELGRKAGGGLFDHSPVLPNDLVGLTNLERLHVFHNFGNYDRSIPIQVSARFLAHAPQVRELWFRNVYLIRPPPDFLTQLPVLRSLILTVDGGVQHIPEDFLSTTPQLQFLELHLEGPEIVLPSNFLSHAPRLQVLRMYVHGETLSRFSPDFLADTPNLEIMTLEVLADGALSLPPQFLSHTPRLEQARIWVMPVYGADTPPVLVIEPTSSMLAHAPRLKELWLQRVGTGLDLVEGLPDATRVYWSPRDSGFFPINEVLALGAHRHWLYVVGSAGYVPSNQLHVLKSNEWLLAKDFRADWPLNVVVSVCGSIASSLEDWLSRQAVQELIVVASLSCSGRVTGVQNLVKLARQQSLPRLTVLTQESYMVPFGLLRGGAYEWLHLDRFDTAVGTGEVFDHFSAEELLLSSVTAHSWMSTKRGDQHALRTLIQAPQVQHLGLVLDVQRLRSSEQDWKDGVWVPPSGLFDDLGFECIDVDLRFQGQSAFTRSASPDVEGLNVDVQLASRANNLVWRVPWLESLWYAHWSSAEDGTYYDRMLWFGDDAWFEQEHLSWAREQECSRSLYLRFDNGDVSLEADMLFQPGVLRRVRIVLPAPPCQNC